VPVAVIYSAEPQPPVIGDILYTPAVSSPLPLPDRLYAKVEPAPGGLASDLVSWVRVYHPNFLKSQGADEDGYVSLRRVTNPFEDPNGWERRGLTQAPLPPNWLPGMRLVAATTGMRYAIRPLDGAEDFRAYRSGYVTLNAMYDYTADDEFWNPETDLDLPPPPPVVTDYTGDSDTWYGVGRLALVWKIGVTGGSWWNWTPAHGMADVYLRDSQGNCPVFVLGFFVSAMKAPYGGDEYYQSLSRVSLESLESQFAPGYVVDVARVAEFEFQKHDVFLFRTTDRDTPGGTTRLGKLVLRNTSGWGPTSGDRCGATVEFAYTIFANEGDP
jgi:hypothetical protein